MLFRLNLICIVLLCIYFTGYTQKVSEYRFSVLNTENGLAGNTVTDIIQDHKGFMWFGTDAGLQRYDGKRFLTFKSKPGNPATIPYNIIEVLHEDKKHNLWVVTADDKIGLFNTNYFTYKEIPIPNQDKDALMGLKTLMEDSSGNLYLSIHQQAKPFFQFSEKEQAFLPAALNSAIPAKWGLNHVFYDNYSNRFWMATDSGLVVHDPVKKESSYRGHNVSNDAVINRLGKERFTWLPYVDQEKNFWCVTAGEGYDPPVIHRFEPENLEYQNHIPWPDIRKQFRQVKDIFSQQNGRVWITGYSFLMEYRKNSPAVFDTISVNDNCNPKSLNFNTAVQIFEDREHTLWIGTNNGLFRFTPDANLFSNYLFQKKPNTIPDEQTGTSLFERKNGELWIGAVQAGLYTLNKDFSPITVEGDPTTKFPAGRSIWSIHEHSKTGLMWMGYSSGHMAVYDPKNGKTEMFTPPLLEGKPAHKIAEDKNGNLWFLTKAFDSTAILLKWDRKLAGDDYKKGFVQVKKIPASLTSIMVDNRNGVWIGTYGEGLQKYNAETNELELRILPESADQRSVLFDNSVSDVIQYNDSLLIAAGNMISVVNIRTNAVTYYTRVDGLPGTVLTVQKDKHGILWLGMMEGGLCRFNLARKIFTVYNKNDGMIDDFFHAGAKLTLSDGRLVLFTSRHIVTFKPEDLAQNASAPPALLTDFKLLNISLPIDSLLQLSRLHIPYDKNSVTIEFSALSYAAQNKINYYYQMEGLDKDWIAADETQKATYNYLPPGKYTLHIKTDNGSSGNVAITKLAITVHAPFWRTWWFWGLIVLVVACILYLLDRERVKRLVSLQKMRTEIAVNLHKDVSSTLNNINLLSEMARIKADKDLDRSKEYIQQISDKSNRMIVAMDDILWSIEPENDSMERSLLRMREFIDALKNRYNADIVLFSDKLPARISLDMRKRHEFFLLFKEALRVVVQIAEGRDTLIHLDTSRNKLVLKLQDATANPYSQQASLDEAIREIENRSTMINAETDVQYDQKGIAIIIQLSLT